MTEKEAAFCAYYTLQGDARAAAAAAGYHNPRRAGMRLLRQPAIRTALRERDAAQENLPAEITRGLRALAFGSVADAIRLLLHGDTLTDAELERLDLFMVSDLKRPKGGGMEIKFFDRLKALETLSRCTNGAAQNENGFLQALAAGAQLLSDGEAETP